MRRGNWEATVTLQAWRRDFFTFAPPSQGLNLVYSHPISAHLDVRAAAGEFMANVFCDIRKPQHRSCLSQGRMVSNGNAGAACMCSALTTFYDYVCAASARTDIAAGVASPLETRNGPAEPGSQTGHLLPGCCVLTLVDIAN